MKIEKLVTHMEVTEVTAVTNFTIPEPISSLTHLRIARSKYFYVHVTARLDTFVSPFFACRIPRRTSVPLTSLGFRELGADRGRHRSARHRVRGLLQEVPREVPEDRLLRAHGDHVLREERHLRGEAASEPN